LKSYLTYFLEFSVCCVVNSGVESILVKAFKKGGFVAKDDNDSASTWRDEDDAPELDEQWLEEAYRYHGNRLLKRGHGRDPFQAPQKEDKDGTN